MPSSFAVQIVIDIAFFVAIMVLLRRLEQRFAGRPPAVAPSLAAELDRLMTDSREAADEFLRTLEKKERRLEALARQLDEREKRLLALLAEMQAQDERARSGKGDAGPVQPEAERYSRAMAMVREGKACGEVAARLGLPEGEVHLIAELERTRAGNAGEPRLPAQAAP